MKYEEVIEKLEKFIVENGYIDPDFWRMYSSSVTRFIKYNPESKDLWDAAKKTFDLSSYKDGYSEARLRSIIKDKNIDDLFNASAILNESIKNDGMQNAVKYLEKWCAKGIFDTLDVEEIAYYIEDSSLAKEALKSHPELFESVQKFFDVTTYKDHVKDYVNELRLHDITGRYPDAAKLLDAKKVLSESIKRDGGRNLAKFLKHYMETRTFMDIERLEYLAKSEFLPEILQENPDILEAVKKSFNVCADGFGYDSRYNLVFAPDEQKEAMYAGELRTIAKTGVFKPFFNAEKLIKESSKADAADKMAYSWLGYNEKVSVHDLKDNLKLVAEALPRHPELIPLIEKSLVIERSDYNQYSPYSSAVDAAERVRNSIDLANGYYVAGKMNILPVTIKRCFKDMENIIGTYLKSDDLNIFQLRSCLKINGYVTEKLIKQSPKIKARVEKLFENPKNYVVQKSFQNSEFLNNLFDVSAKLDIAEANLRKISGSEVFDILTAPESAYPEAREADRQREVLQKYLAQSEDLSEHSPDADLNYTYFGEGSYWSDFCPILDDVGSYKCAPEVAAMVEDRIGRIFSLYNYHNKSRETDCYSYASTAGMEFYAEQMLTEVLKDPDSYKSQFYLKHALNVLDQWQGCNNRLKEVVDTLLPEMAERGRFDIYEKVLDIAGLACSRYSRMNGWKKDNMLKALSEDINSPISQIYLKNTKKYFSGLDEISDVIAGFAEKDKGAHPEVFDKLCADMLEVYNSGKKVSANSEHNLLAICKDYQNPQIITIVESFAQKENADIKKLLDYNTKWQISGLKCYEDLVDRTLAGAKELIISSRFNSDIDYKPLHEKLKAAELETIKFENFEKLDPEIVKQLVTEQKCLKSVQISGKCTLSADNLTPAPALEKISHEGIYHVELNNLSDILEKLPNLVSIERIYSVPKEEEKKLSDYLLKSKPEKLVNLSICLPGEAAKDIMEKYPLFTVDVSYSSPGEKDADVIYKRNKQIQKVVLEGKPITDKEILNDLIETKGVVKCLEVMPPEKRPSLETFYEGQDSIINQMKKAAGSKEEAIQTIGGLLKILGVQEKDVTLLAESVAGKEVAEAIGEWHTKQAMDKGEAAAQAAFKAWQESKGNKR